MFLTGRYRGYDSPYWNHPEMPYRIGIEYRSGEPGFHAWSRKEDADHEAAASTITRWWRTSRVVMPVLLGEAHVEGAQVVGRIMVIAASSDA